MCDYLREHGVCCGECDRQIAQVSTENMSNQARDIMERFNGWPRRNEALYRHESLLTKLFKKYNLETMCTVCCAIMPTSRRQVKCAVCGSSNTCSPYYC